MLYSEMKKKAAAELQAAGIEEYEVDAEYLLQHASGLERNELFIRWNEEIPNDIEEKYRSLIDRRKSHEPLQYIIGNQDFMGYTFMVTPDVLIPRFDTEILAELAIKRAREDINYFNTDEVPQVMGTAANIDNEYKSDAKYRILDLCTGSGCVATSVGLSLYEKQKNYLVDVTGADISSAAVALAKKNWELNIHNLYSQHENYSKDTVPADIAHVDISNAINDTQSNNFCGKTGTATQKIKATFIESDLFRNVEGKFNLITANPPYIVRDEIKTLMPEITEHEPHLALDGGEDGMDFYRKIVREAPNYLLPGGRLMMEFDDAEAESVAKMMETAGFKDICIHKDLAGLRRVIEGKHAGS